jgi:hypothetical protein
MQFYDNISQNSKNERCFKKFVEKIPTRVLFENRAVYEILWNNMVQLDSPQLTTQYGACALNAKSLKAADTHLEYVILLYHGDSGYENMIHCYVVRTYV